MADFFDRLLEQPSAEDVEPKLRKAVQFVNDRVAHRPTSRLPWPLDELDTVLEALATSREGMRCWHVRDDHSAWPEPGSGVAVYWWTNFPGRRLVRVIGYADRSVLFWPGFLRGDPTGPMPLLAVAPRQARLRDREGRLEPVVFCECGVWGTPAEIGWMGLCCGPCHDHAESTGSPLPGVLPPRCWPMRDEPIAALTFSADSRLVVLATKNLAPKEGHLALWDVEQRTKLGGVRCGIAGTVELAHRDDGVACRRTNDLHLWTAGGHLRDLRPRGARMDCAALAPDGRFAAFRSGEELLVWDLDAGESVRTLHAPEFLSASLAPNGTAIALRTREGVVLHPLTLAPSTGIPLELSPTPAMAFSPDGSLVAAAVGVTLHVCDAATGKKQLKYRWVGAQSLCLAWTPDGRTLAVGDAGGCLITWPVEAL
jgi:hypothetical protein